MPDVAISSSAMILPKAEARPGQGSPPVFSSTNQSPPCFLLPLHAV